VTTRPGFALLVSLLMTMALAAIGAGMLAVAVREAEVATAMAERSRTRAAAEAAVRAALAGWSTRRHADLVVGDVATVAGGDAQHEVVRVRRLDATLYLLEATAEHPSRPVPARATAAVLVRTLDQRALAGEYRAAVAAASAAHVRGGAVSGSDACGHVDPVVGVIAPQVATEPTAVVAGEPAIVIAEPSPAMSAELLDPPFVHHLASITVDGGKMAPRPSSDAGRCGADGLNWGAVSPLSPCHGLLPLIHSTGDLALRDGEARAMIVVDGDLHLERFRLHGVLLVRGRLTVGPGSVIRGAVRADTFDMLDGSLGYDACAVADAVTAGGLDAPFRPGQRWWIPTF
jgi:hypothetical protein